MKNETRNTIIIVDLEATCSGKKDIQNEIIEIGAVKIIDGVIVDDFDEFVKPIINPSLTDFCKSLTSILQEDVDAADTFDMVLPSFLNWIGEEPFILASWGNYDKYQFFKDCNLHNLSSDWIKEHINIKEKFSEIKKCKPCGMQKALKIMGLDLIGTHHRGIDDAKNIAQIFIKCQGETKFVFV